MGQNQCQEGLEAWLRFVIIPLYTAAALEAPGEQRSFASGVNSHCAATAASSSLGSSIVWL
jgi:hypothetical protein